MEPFGSETADPERLGLDPVALGAAVEYALAHESTMDRDIGKALEAGHFGEPWPIGQTIGLVKPRGGPSGMILRRGQVVAQWGDVARVDMTFSISKSYLALLAGIAVQDGLIADIHAPVSDLVTPHFDSDQNRQITWAQLLTLTSEWQGTLWDKPDWIDHYRDLNAAPGAPSRKGEKRPLQAPGTYWEYNDVRVNALAFALLQVFRQPLAKVLRGRIMNPIGASDTWDWHGYDNSWVQIDGQNMQSVSGGAHWGGGLWISTQDHARLGQLMLQNGVWNEQEILSPNWISTCRTPCALNKTYGCLWWLNTDQAQFPALSEQAYFALGVGSQILWIDPKHEMTGVTRWIEKSRANGFFERMIAALR